MEAEKLGLGVFEVVGYLFSGFLCLALLCVPASAAHAQIKDALLNAAQSPIPTSLAAQAEQRD